MGWWPFGSRDKRAAPASNDAGVPRWARPVTSSVTFSANLPPELTGLIGDGPPAPRVGRAQAMSVPAVKRGRDLICGTLGTLRLKKLDARRRRVPSELLDQPEADVARSVTMTRVVEDMLFEGRAWLRITEFDAYGYPAKVVRLEPRTVTVRENARVWVSNDGVTQGQSAEYVPDALLIRIDSPNDALLVAGARAIRAALALERSAARYADTGMPLGYLTPADGMDPGDDDDVEEIVDDFEDAISRRAWPYMNGIKANVLSWNPEQLQLSSARDYAVLEISRLIGIDPEELGVSTTSRTYANSEQRRLDMVDFTLAAYVSAIEDRLSMPDVTPPGYYIRAEYGGFLRSDTKTRMETYEIGRRVGVYNDARIAELEDIPDAKPAPSGVVTAGGGPDARALAEIAQKIYLAVPTVLSADEARTILNLLGAGLTIPAPVAPTAPAASPSQQQEQPVPQSTAPAPSLAFSTDNADAITVGFVLSDSDAEFRVNPEKRTVSGLTVPWNVAARSGGYMWKFAEGSLHYASESRVKLDRDHMPGSEVGKAVRLQTNRLGLDGSFKVARGVEGDQLLALAEDGVYDGFSIQADFSSEGDGWTADPTDERVRLVHSATLRKVAITAMPAFDDARVATVAATRGNGAPTMTAPAAVQPPTTPGAPAGPAPAPAFDMAAFTAGLSEAVTASVTAAIQALPLPQHDPTAVPPRQVVPAGRVEVTREAPVYTMNGAGPSFVRDAWRARTENDSDARERLSKYQKQTAEFAQKAHDAVMFGADTGSAAAVIPPGYRPDLYVTQLMQGRPLVDAVSRGTLTDATPFTLPKFVSSSGMTANHVEGVNPTDGTMDIDTITVTPTGISGLFELTREIVDSANPAIDAIAMQAMQESYSQQSEAKVYAELNGTNGQGGTITSGFVPSGAQASTTSGQGDELIAGVRAALALYPFRRFGSPNRALLSQEGTTGFATAVGSDGRPLLPSIGAQNTAGLGNAVTQGWFVDGLPFQPAWSMTGNASGDADALVFNSNDAWAWESALLTFRFEERGGPARIDLALFGYFATRLLRPVGLTAVRHTAS